MTLDSDGIIFYVSSSHTAYFIPDQGDHDLWSVVGTNARNRGHHLNSDAESLAQIYDKKE